MPFVMIRIGKKWSFIAGQTLAAICFVSASVAIAVLFDIERKR